MSVTEKTYIDIRIDESSKHNEDKSINISYVPSGKSRDRGVEARPAVPANGNFVSTTQWLREYYAAMRKGMRDEEVAPPKTCRLRCREGQC